MLSAADWQVWPAIYIEDKLDGERVHAHITRALGKVRVRMFSRRNEEFVDYARVLAPYLQRALAPDVSAVILDGEMLTWDDSLKRFGAFSDNKDASARMTADATSPRHLCFVIFDVVFVKGFKPRPQLPGTAPWPAALDGDISSRVLSDRKRILDAIMNDVPRYVERIHTTLVTADPKGPAVWAALDRAIANNLEGVMMKRADSTYTRGRSMFWMKLKPEHAEGASQTMDIAIVGGYFSVGSRGGVGDGIASFLVAVAGEERLPPRDGQLEGVAKVY